VTTPPPTATVYQYPDEPIGPNWDDLLQADAIAVRDALATIGRRWQFVGTNPPGVSQTAYNGYELLNTVAQIYLGLINQPQPYNFDNATAPARRGS
jgi:hypothetical protein